MKAMYSAAAILPLIVVIFLPVLITCQRTAYLYYSSHSQAGGRPGLYVSGVNGAGGVQGATTVTGTRRFQTDCSEATTTTTQSQWLRSLSFDAARGRLLMMTGRKQHDDDSGFSLISAPACHECDNNGTDIYQYFTDALISPPQFKVYGFLINSRRVYFIGERKRQIDTHSTRHRVELRRLTLGGRCAQLYPVTSTSPFDIDDCSRLIALIVSDTYSNNPVYQPLEGLLAVSHSNTVDIYAQLQRLTYDSTGNRLSEVAIELYHVRYRVTSSDDEADRQQSRVSDERPAPVSASAEPIHRAVLSPLYRRYTLTNRGGMSAKDGWMCWSAVDRVLCGRLTSSGSVVDAQTLLRHDAVAGSICQGSKDLANVITGVALVKATDEISFYFGCIAQARGMGGAGLFVGSHNDESDRRVYKLDGNDSLVVGVVRAGAMFIADSEMCDIKAVWDKITGNSAACLHVYWSAVVVTPISMLLTEALLIHAFVMG